MESECVSYADAGIPQMTRNTQSGKARSKALRAPSGRIAGEFLPVLPLDPAGAVAMHRQLYEALRDAILAARLRPEGRLPATRSLASHLGISRTTVALAYDQLRAEGYLTGRERSGTFVARTLPDDTMRVRGPTRRKVAPMDARVPLATLSDRGQRMGALHVSASGVPATGVRAFRYGTPALEAFPGELWRRLHARRWRGTSRSHLGYGDPQGLDALREAIADYARVARGVRCTAAQVLVVSGSQQGLDLAARLLLDPGDEVWMEDPGYLGARSAFEAGGACVAPVPVDDEGLRVQDGEAMAPRARLAYVTPSHQFPTGSTMSVARRLALVSWARRSGAWILEDDYDSEFRFRGRPLPSLQGLADDGPVVYMGTFSKTLFPALRLGYLIVPAALTDAFANARAIVDRHSPTVDQHVLADFIAEGHYARHIRRVRELYAERQEVLLRVLARELDRELEPVAFNAGMHLIAYLRDGGLSDAAVSVLGHAEGVDATPLSRLAQRPVARQALLLGYSAFDQASMEGGATRLRRAFDRARRAIATSLHVGRPDDVPAA
jgi:GntR family transcriptional regulator / MocR family aminotransferase